MAQANGVNQKDKVRIEDIDPNEKMNIVMAKDSEDTSINIDEVNADMYYKISDRVEHGVRFLTEATEVYGVGIVQKDTVFSRQEVATTTVLLPKVRIVAKILSDGSRDGYQFIGINETTLQESGAEQDRSRR
tara:strand:+ start:746 stop:1141 length:396 start_codon:yes stop_codon:yes gene_type:complete